MRKRKKLLWTVSMSFVLFLWCAGTLMAAEKKAVKDYEAYDLGEVVVNAAKPAPEVTTTTTITADDIKATGSHTVADVLSHAPGLRITTGAKNHASVTINGFDQSRALVLIDGVPYYETKFGFLDLNMINTENIAKIEIIKGASSVLYGANAIAGVINIITKKGTEKPYTSASAEMSENNTYRFSAVNGMKAGLLSYWLSYTFEKSNGWYLSDDYKPKTGTLTDRRYAVGNPNRVTTHVFEDGGVRDNSDYRTHKLWGKFGLDRNPDSQYFVTFHYLTDEEGSPSNVNSNNVFSRPVFSQFYADRLPEYDNWGIDLDARQRLTEKLIAKAKFFYHSHNDSLYSYEDPTFSNVLAMSHYRDYLMGGSVSLEYQPVAWNAIRMAVHYQGDSHEEIADEYLPYDHYFSYTGSVGIEDEFTLIKNLSITAGLSYDWFEVTRAEKATTNGAGDMTSYGGVYAPNDGIVDGMIGANYTFADTTKVYASFARKSRFPTLNNLYNVVAAGDPHLSPEKSRNYTVGASRSFGSCFKGEVSLFWYDITDRITSIGSGANKRMVNIGETRVRGAEIGVEAYLINDLTLRADYTRLEAEDRSANAVSKNVTGVPEDIFHVSAQYTVPVIRTVVDASASYMASVYNNVTPGSEEKIGDYVLCDFKITQPFAKHYEVYVQAKNLFDKNYESEYGYPAPGRSFWTGVSVKF